MSWVGKLNIHLAFLLPTSFPGVSGGVLTLLLPSESWGLGVVGAAFFFFFFLSLSQHPRSGRMLGFCPVALEALGHLWAPFQSEVALHPHCLRLVPYHHSPSSRPLSPNYGFPCYPTAHATCGRILRGEWGLVKVPRDHPFFPRQACKKPRPRLFSYFVLSHMTAQGPASGLGYTPR